MWKLNRHVLLLLGCAVFGAAAIDISNLRVPNPFATSDEYTPAAMSDMITNMPGLSKDPGFKQFSGYLQIPGTGRFIFYWYVESRRNPSTDPLVLWTNGGPGCSGLLGFGTEMGPFYFEENDVVSENPYSWNNIANMIYIEQPAGVGFSYSTDEADYNNVGDSRAAADKYQVILQFLQRFPERRSNDFYIASESYGGHYIPHLALEILKQNTNNQINFRGFLVGNPFVDPFSNDITQYEAYYQHGLLPKPLFDQWRLSCTDRSSYDVEKCTVIVNAMFNEMGSGINPYALDYPMCTESSPDYPPLSQSKRLLGITTPAANPPFLPSSDKYKPCAEAHLFKYLNRSDVRTALHVSITPEQKKWGMCSDLIQYNQDDILTPQMNLYQELLTQPNLRMMVFSGDDDSVCSTAGTQYWIYDLGASPKPDMFWKAWKVDQQTAGYVTYFDLSHASSTFAFVTVHGAGHEVPAYRPKEALQLFQSFFSGQWEIDTLKPIIY